MKEYTVRFTIQADGESREDAAREALTLLRQWPATDTVLAEVQPFQGSGPEQPWAGVQFTPYTHPLRESPEDLSDLWYHGDGMPPIVDPSKGSSAEAVIALVVFATALAICFLLGALIF